MTRQEYEQATDNIMPIISKCSFPERLDYVAKYCFKHGDIDSIIAIETRRRLIELDEKGFTL